MIELKNFDVFLLEPLRARGVQWNSSSGREGCHRRGDAIRGECRIQAQIRRLAANCWFPAEK